MDGSRVLLADYGDRMAMDCRVAILRLTETPDEVMQRELFEELGLTKHKCSSRRFHSPKR